MDRFAEIGLKHEENWKLQVAVGKKWKNDGKTTSGKCKICIVFSSGLTLDIVIATDSPESTLQQLNMSSCTVCRYASQHVIEDLRSK